MGCYEFEPPDTEVAEWWPVANPTRLPPMIPASTESKMSVRIWVRKLFFRRTMIGIIVPLKVDRDAGAAFILVEAALLASTPKTPAPV